MLVRGLEPRFRIGRADLGAGGGWIRDVLLVVWNDIFQLRRSCADPIVEAIYRERGGGWWG
jgi:hypothetical protein